MTDHDPIDDAVTPALRAVAEDDRQLGASPAVEARLLQEVAAIAASRRRAAMRPLLVAAVLALAVAASVWSVRRPAVARLAVSEGPAPEQTTEFFPLHYSGVPMADPQIVRLEVRREALATFGLDTRDTPVNDAAATVLADVIVGSDGLARAIRFVWPPSDARREEQRQ